MKLGVFNPLFNELTLDEMLDTVVERGLETVEVGTGGNPGSAHIDVDKLLESSEARKAYLKKFADKGLTISAFSTHNNPISPDKETAKKADESLRKTIKLAHLMDVPVVNTFSGISSANEEDKEINWPVIPWPNEYADNYHYQWEKKLIPYWKEINQIAKEADVKIGIEMHGGFLVHTPYTMLKLREEAGDQIGCNFDPSHMWWQGIDPVAAIKILAAEDAIYHFHAKDTYLDQDNINMYGLTDMQPYSDVRTRAWTFRSVGEGHSLEDWSEMIAALRIYGYDYVLSIEHEDPIMSIDEGLNRAIRNLQSIMIKEEPNEIWWV
ncbi:MAG: sugar phosphate isomerase/epimerase [Atopostipes sp.]|nr:sugar phosphate isomerase/epimerase [Atopostipes sp.]